MCIIVGFQKFLIHEGMLRNWASKRRKEDGSKKRKHNKEQCSVVAVVRATIVVAVQEH